MLKEFLFGNEAERSAKQVIKNLGHEGNLNARKRRQLKEAEAKRRWLFLRQAIVFGGLTLASVTAAVEGFTGNISSYLNQPTDGFSLTIKDRHIIGERRAVEIEKAAKDWNNLYKCKRSVEVKPFEVKDNPSLPGHEIIEQADSGSIFISKEGDARNLILHAMGHACKKDEVKQVDPPIKYTDGEIVSIKGFMLQVKLRNGRLGWYKEMEEGFVDLLAKDGFSNYAIDYALYYELRELTRSYMMGSKVDFERMRENDLEGFIRIASRAPEGARITGQDYDNIIASYKSTTRRFRDAPNLYPPR